MLRAFSLVVIGFTASIAPHERLAFAGGFFHSKGFTEISFSLSTVMSLVVHVKF